MKRIAVCVIFLATALVALPRPSVSQTAPASRPPVPAYAHGSPDNMTVYLDFGDRLAGGGVALGDNEVYTIFYRVAEKLCPTLGVTVTTVPPAKRPGEYVTVRFLSDDVVPWRSGVVGNCPVKAMFNTSWYAPNVVYVARMEPNAAGAVAAHEAVHCLQPDGVSHEDAPVGTLPNLMAPACPTNGVLSPNMILLVKLQITELQDGQRMGAYLTSTGQWTFGWHDIGE